MGPEHRQGVASKLVSIKDVGVEEFFYSKLGGAGESTLDDLITSFEKTLDADLRVIRRAPVGVFFDAAVPARLATHLVLRTAHVRSIFQQLTTQILDWFSTQISDPSRLRDLFGLDTDVGMERILKAIGEEVWGLSHANIFALSRHAERILWTTGLLPWPIDDGRLYVAFGAPIPPFTVA